MGLKAVATLQCETGQRKEGNGSAGDVEALKCSTCSLLLGDLRHGGQDLLRNINDADTGGSQHAAVCPATSAEQWCLWNFKSRVGLKEMIEARCSE